MQRGKLTTHARKSFRRGKHSITIPLTPFLYNSSEKNTSFEIHSRAFQPDAVCKTRVQAPPRRQTLSMEIVLIWVS